MMFELVAVLLTAIITASFVAMCKPKKSAQKTTTTTLEPLHTQTTAPKSEFRDATSFTVDSCHGFTMVTTSNE
uniref:Secreted protein n=1 Tax=Panagrellus redivivus TaxID=6233 RepID=A0A7E4VXE0_PANRE